MDTLKQNDSSMNRRRGQTLAEFAITLPILLLIMFGIIEFGRVFQAWVSLQNAARAAARYASTRQYYEDQYVMDLNPSDDGNYNDPDGFIPCVDDGPDGTYTAVADARGTRATIIPSAGTVVNVYTGGLESLFATWYDGKNCDPRDRKDQERRKDMARILSIMVEARRGAAGLALADWNWNIPTTAAGRNNITGEWQNLPWFQVMETPPVGSDQRSWFNVMICSNQRFIQPNSTGLYSRGSVAQNDTRFVINLGEGDLVAGGVAVTPWDPSCQLNEQPSPMHPGGFSNAGVPWLDPGTGNDTVTVVVSLNHPLIMPLLNLGNYLPLQARRTAIVEAFREVDPRGAVGAPAGSALGAPTLTYTPIPPTPEPPTATPRPTDTPVPPPTLTNTPVGPFNCALVTATNPRLVGNQYQVDIQNGNGKPTYLTRAIFTWPTIASISGLYVSQLALNGAAHWSGVDRQDTASTFNTTDTNNQASDPSTILIDNVPVANRTVSGGQTGVWTGTILGVANLSAYMAVNNYGVAFTLNNPDNPASPCTITITAQTPSTAPTPVPNCTNGQLIWSVAEFQQFGVVRLEIANGYAAPVTLVGFQINWRRAPSNLILRRVTALAPYGLPGAVLIWDSNSSSQDSSAPTRGGTITPAEGLWVQNFTFEAGTPGNPRVTNIYLDFDGVTGLVGMNKGDINESIFALTCANNPPANVTVVPQPTPLPTNTPRPSNTPGPTNTPRPPTTPPPPTNTPPPGPTNTPRPPTNTPVPQPTATWTPLPGGGSGGCTQNC
jgi:hypothetical protein